MFIKQMDKFAYLNKLIVKKKEKLGPKEL